MLIKKLLIFLVFLFPVSLINDWSVASEKMNDADALIEKFGIIYMENPSIFPDIDLLQTALSGYEMLRIEHTINRPEVITIIDFSLPSNKKRLWVIDLIDAKVLFHCLVSHGRNSGDLQAENFSNSPGSYASSPGFFTTGETYSGKNGFSLRLDGIEKGINDKARERAIVMHGADYVSADFINKNGRLGRSLGCPAVPEELNNKIIETIKGGSCLFVYTPTESYLNNSSILSKISTIKKG